MQLSKNFTLKEMTNTMNLELLEENRAYAEDPLIQGNLIVLTSTVLQPLRDLVNVVYTGGYYVSISSGVRCPKLNEAVGGSKKSAHMSGRAADFVVPCLGLHKTMKLLKLHKDKIKFDKVILEYEKWIHIQVAKPSNEPRGQVLRADWNTETKEVDYTFY